MIVKKKETKTKHPEFKSLKILQIYTIMKFSRSSNFACRICFSIHKACFISERDKVPFISFANNGSQYKEKIDKIRQVVE